MSKKDDLYSKEALLPELTEVVTSPCGVYQLTILHYKTGEHTWNYTRGVVTVGDKDPICSPVDRNYSIFWYEWVIDHPITHSDYLLCGADYQGYTIVDLVAGKRKDYLSKGARSGHGFCWATVEYLRDGEKGPELHVEGCYWGASYEKVVYDFSRPDKLPYPELSREDMPFVEEEEEEV